MGANGNDTLDISMNGSLLEVTLNGENPFLQRFQRETY
jgi:hypothetical protein